MAGAPRAALKGLQVCRGRRGQMWLERRHTCNAGVMGRGQEAQSGRSPHPLGSGDVHKAAVNADF